MFHNGQGGVIGDPPSLHETRFQAGGGHRLADRRTPAMHHHRPHADRLHEDNVDQQVFQAIGVLHDAAPQLDHRNFIAQLADPAEGFDQDSGFLNGSFHRARLGENKDPQVAGRGTGGN